MNNYCSIPNCPNKNVTFVRNFYHIPQSNAKNSALLKERSHHWKKLCRHPAETHDKKHPDWLPWLKLDPRLPDNPLKVRRRMQEYYQQRKCSQETLCVIKGCINSGSIISNNMQSFEFPKLDMTSYINRVLSEKRLLLWLQVVDQPDSWKQFDFSKLKICPRHFVSGKMADLTDVENVDWIPTIALEKKLNFTDHVAHFDLYNIISLIKDSCSIKGITEKNVNLSFPTANTVPITMAPATNQPHQINQKNPTAVPLDRVDVGLKCILCLESTSLKPIDSRSGTAINALFNTILNVNSEVICSKCSKSIEEFYCFYELILRIQQNFPTEKNNAILAAASDNRTPKVEGSISITSKVKNRKLFKVLSADYFQCIICELVMFRKNRIIQHLQEAHKVKLNYKEYKQRFSPIKSVDHKNICSVASNIKRDTEKALTKDSSNKNQEPMIAEAIHTNKDDDLKEQKRHSCYICKNFYSPDEMIEHIKTHETERDKNRELIELGEKYEACKQCQKAILKDDMEQHLEEHEAKRARRREFIKKQQEKNKYTCFKCNKDFQSLYALDKHTKSHKIVGSDDKIICPDCNHIVKANYFKYHCQLIHDDVLLACDKCGKQMSRMALKKHQLTCDDTTVPCDICGKTIKMYMVKSHIAKVHSNKPFKCRFCPKVYDSKDYAGSHERWSHREEWDQRRRVGIKELNLDRSQLEEALGLRKNSDNSEEAESSCPVCLNVHGNETVVETHMRKAHPKEHLAMIMNGVPIISSNEDARLPKDKIGDEKW
ncbi:uncharacterized protein LOC131430811 isoform X2 [Malaya genurostris]|uniref:uncharacterized protein LOC131430811 isoform X2 n=1 Tax=Malaya genurostris TaxID=325434 RepID=UPI0026F3C39A|nr:uncharacterized protein LOC131430811 isoform X2 [Malaya genurostris]